MSAKQLRSVTLGLALGLVGCVDEPIPEGRRLVRIDASDAPVAWLSPQELERFRAGDELFEAVFREPDGLGPLYIRTSCSGCHAGDGRGPGRVTRFGLLESERALRGAAFPFGDTARPYFLEPATTPVEAPELEGLILSQRLPPAVFGRGYLEAVSDEEIERLGREAQGREGVVRGRVARVPGPDGKSRIGRFGLKAKIADLREFTAKALQDDMGLTSPLYPEEVKNPDALTDDAKPGVDVTDEQLDALTDYVRFLALPRPLESPPEGARLFASTGCATCHVPTLRLREDSPLVPRHAPRANLYTDVLLHDMGAALADGVREGDAGAREWRTAPLVGLRFSPGYLHDGRAATVHDAILNHRGEGSEANPAVATYEALPALERKSLLQFVESL